MKHIVVYVRYRCPYVIHYFHLYERMDSDRGDHFKVVRKSRQDKQAIEITVPPLIMRY